MGKKIEQPVVDMVRKILVNDLNYPLPSTKENSNHLIVYEQDSYKVNQELERLLKHSSKCSKKSSDNLWTDKAEYGKPEYTIINTHDNLAIVIECKVNIQKKHNGKRLKEENILEKKQSIISSNACEGALHYAKFLSDTYDVIAIGITGNLDDGNSVTELKVTTYAWEKQKAWVEDKSGPFINLEVDSLMSYTDYINLFKKVDIVKKNMLETNALNIAKDLNETLHSASVPPIERSLLVSGLLLALKDEVYLTSYKNKKISDKRLRDILNTSINTVLVDLGVKDTFKKDMLKTKFADVFTQTGLLKDNARLLREVSKQLEESVSPCMTGDFSIDIVGKFYSEFLRYAKGDKASGIVLTPSHITELFCDLVKLNIDDVVLDPCAGTAGFLIAAMNRLYLLADKQPDSINIKENIKKNQLFGCDDDKQMFALGCSNMILRGDGKANMYFGSCYDNFDELCNKATIGMINPPYSGTDQSCLNFVDFLCRCIKYKDDNGTYIGKSRSKGDNYVCAILPISYMNSEDYREERVKLLQNNTLVAVMSMPIDLFRPISTITCIIILKAGIPHDSEIPTYLGNWKDDGYTWKKGIGRVPNGTKPNEIKLKWLKSFKRTEEDKDIGIWKCLDGSDECCWERYAETDYSMITQTVFENEVKNYMIYKLNDISLTDFNDMDDKEDNEDIDEES